MNHSTDIDPIGESNLENKQLDHDLVCGLDSDIKTMTDNIEELSDLISRYETYTENVMMVSKLKILHHRLSNGIKAIESGYNDYKNLHE